MADEIVPQYTVNGGKTCCENAFIWRKRGAAGADAGAGAGARAGGGARAGAGARAGVWCRTASGVAKKNLDDDLIAKQRLVKPDGPVNHGLNGRGVWIIEDRAVKCWMNDQSRGTRCRSRDDIRVSARTAGSVRTHPIVVGRPRIQSGYSAAIHIAHVQAVITVHVTAERGARGDIQQVSFRPAHAVPSRHKAA